jgi:hypothetical protein
MKRIAAEEVRTELAPVLAALAKLNSWKLSLWANGSGGPPGYLEKARQEDDERYGRLLAMAQESSAARTCMNNFMSLHEDREKRWDETKSKLFKIGWKAAVGLFAVFMAVMGWAYHATAPVLKILWEDYLRAHPIAEQKLKTLSYNPECVVVASEAALPNMR